MASVIFGDFGDLLEIASVVIPEGIARNGVDSSKLFPSSEVESC